MIECEAPWATVLLKEPSSARGVSGTPFSQRCPVPLEEPGQFIGREGAALQKCVTTGSFEAELCETTVGYGDDMSTPAYEWHLILRAFEQVLPEAKEQAELRQTEPHG